MGRLVHLLDEVVDIVAKAFIGKYPALVGFSVSFRLAVGLCDLLAHIDLQGLLQGFCSKIGTVFIICGKHAYFIENGFAGDIREFIGIFLEGHLGSKRSANRA